MQLISVAVVIPFNKVFDEKNYLILLVLFRSFSVAPEKVPNRICPVCEHWWCRVLHRSFGGCKWRFCSIFCF